MGFSSIIRSGKSFSVDKSLENQSYFMRTTSKKFSIGQLSRRISNINLDPFFQREKVWPLTFQQYFMDTIIKGWGTPKIYLAVKKDSQGEENYICIDGKQRLTAIFSFLRRDGFKLSSKYSSEFKNKSYYDLPKSIQDEINRYKITVERVFDYSDQELGELFKRLQRGRALTSGEKLRANNTKITRFINSLIKGNDALHKAYEPVLPTTPGIFGTQ